MTGIVNHIRALIPLFITFIVLVLTLALQWIGDEESFRRSHFWTQIEWSTYDARLNFARNYRDKNFDDFGFVNVNDETIEALSDGSYGYQFGLYWPRLIYGTAVKELKAQGAEVIGFDIIFAENRPDHDVFVVDGMTSDEYFMESIYNAENVVLAGARGVLPPMGFQLRASGLGNVAIMRDPDGSLRRTRAFEDFILWDPLFRNKARAHNWLVEFESDRVVYKDPDTQEVTLEIPVNEDAEYDARLLNSDPDDSAVLEALEGFDETGNDMEVLGIAYEKKRVWDMGLIAAARKLGLDLENAEITPGDRILLKDAEGSVTREIPIDRDNAFMIPWQARIDEKGANGKFFVDQVPFEQLLLNDYIRENEPEMEVSDLFQDKVVFIGSTAVGGDLTDLGPTPIGKETYLVSKHFNVAKAILDNSFIYRTPKWAESILILVMCTLAAALTWKGKALRASLMVLGLTAVYVIGALWLFVESQIWVPVTLPLGGAFLMNHVCIVSYRVIQEQKERQRVKTVFSKIVSPSVVNELLLAESLSLGGSRRRLTVFFADVRGFTEMTDKSQALVEQQIEEYGLQGAEAEQMREIVARDVLSTVNLYLGIISDVIRKYDGTLDKYMGDCVMAFWNAPIINEKHALSCVRAAVESQLTIKKLNEIREQENIRRSIENEERFQRGDKPLFMLPVLTLGTGINTGEVTVGLMGSERNILNYTVFGREVNLASRLEGVSGRGRIVISENTYRDLLRDDPKLGARCRELDPVMVKGIADPVKIYEVPWRDVESDFDTTELQNALRSSHP